ncbi:MAG: DUF4270 family protein [Saprospiraceae bacterium]
MTGKSPLAASPKRNLPFAFAALAVLALWAGCTKSTPFGSDLLDDEVANYDFTDTLPLQFRIEREDSVYSSDLISSSDYFLCGKINDPVFGATESEIFTLFELGQFSPKFKGSDGQVGKLDSVVMFLALDSKGFYGDTLQRQTIKVTRLNPGAQLDWDSNYYSNRTLPADEELGSATYQILPSRRDSLIFGYGPGQKSQREVVGRGAFIRVPLNNSFGQELLGYDSLDYTADTLFWQKLRGIRLKTETPDPRAMSAFDLNNSTYSRVTLFYRIEGDTAQKRYHFYFTGGNKFMHFTHDYAGSEAGNAIGKPNHNLVYLQGMGGLKVRLDIPNADSLRGSVINKAELELTTAALPSDNPAWYWPAPQIVLRDTSRLMIPDVYYAAGPLLNQGFEAFGGMPRKEVIAGQTVYKYRMQLTQRFQDMVDKKSGDLQGNTLYLNIYPQVSTPSRAVFFGQDGGTFSAKLSVKYTRLK